MSDFIFNGFGIIDDRTTTRTASGKPVCCPHFAAWQSIIIRCYSEKHRHKYLSYEGCTVDERWRLFSNFKKWRESQDWKGKQVDKDLLVEGNRVYGPDTCAMISRSLNTFLTPCGHPDLMPGVIVGSCSKYKPIRYTYPFSLVKKKQKETAFDSELEAHIQWLKNKDEIANIHADRETDERVVAVLRTRWSEKLKEFS